MRPELLTKSRSRYAQLSSQRFDHLLKLPVIRHQIPRANPVASAVERRDEPSAVDGLEEVIERVDFEGVERVLVVRRDEDDVRYAFDADGLDHRESVHSWHSDVEIHEVGRVAKDRRHGFSPVATLADDFDVPLRIQPHADALARKRFVVHDQRSNPLHTFSAFDLGVDDALCV